MFFYPRAQEGEPVPNEGVRVTDHVAPQRRRADECLVHGGAGDHTPGTLWRLLIRQIKVWAPKAGPPFFESAIISPPFSVPDPCSDTSQPRQHTGGGTVPPIVGASLRNRLCPGLTS
jgi:hypothetical protein